MLSIITTTIDLKKKTDIGDLNTVLKLIQY